MVAGGEEGKDGRKLNTLVPLVLIHQRQWPFLDSTMAEYSTHVRMSQPLCSYILKDYSNFGPTIICCKNTDIPRIQFTIVYSHFWTPFHQNMLQICGYPKTSKHQRLLQFLDSSSPEFAVNMQISQDFNTPKVTVISGLHLARICIKYADIKRL